MNNRFSALLSDNSDNGNNINSNKNNKTKVSKHNGFSSNNNDVKPRENIFKQKPKSEREQSKSRDQYKSRDQKKNACFSGNQFKKNQQKIKQEFKMESENFPNLLNILETDDKKVDTAKELTYSEKIIQQKKSIEVENPLPNGWIYLNAKTLAERKIQIINNKKDEYSEYYNLYNSRLIMENRRRYREELNDILGDISPYWNIIDDEEEYDEDDLNDDYSDEDDNEYYDEYW